MSYRNFKRLLDILISIFGLLFLSPLLLIIAIAIKADSAGPVIFRQHRLGKNGKVFVLYKFRTMCVDAEREGVYEKVADTRVTTIGKFLRKTSLDELPQFVNVLENNMSIIGPRPTLTYHPWSFDKYTNEQKKRFSIKPGLTGWAQINGRKDISWKKRIEYDIEYADNISLNFDIKIFFRSLIYVLRMKNNLNVLYTSESASSCVLPETEEKNTK